jgi:primosomal protein N' (replication factor Y)
LEQPAESSTGLDLRPTCEARVSLLIPTHALPPLSYRIPEHLEERVRVGSVVVAPLSGYSRLGVVVSVGEGERASEDLRSVSDKYALPPETIELCRWASDAAAVPLSSVIRAALPPGVNTGRYRVLDPLPEWPWESGKLVGRPVLRRVLGGDGLRTAEEEGRVELAVQEPERRVIEWAAVRKGAAPDLSRAPRQRELFAVLEQMSGGYPVKELLSENDASRATLRALVGRGAAVLERRPEPPPVLTCRDEPDVGLLRPFVREAGRIVDVGGAWMWRIPTMDHCYAVAAVACAAIEGGEQALVLVPEIEAVDDLARKLQRTLPAGHKVAAYHSGLGRDRAAVYEAARSGEVDVLVGTRSAALIPMPKLGAICVVDEPDEGHRAEPGYEGLPIHIREVVRERGWVEGAGTLFLSPHPSLRLYAEKPEIRELPPRIAEEWPSASIVDVRGSGVSLSPTMLESCKRSVEAGRRVGIIANRLGYSTSISCNACGTVQSCPDCDLPMSLHKPMLVCNRCGYSKRVTGECGACGSGRLTPTGLAVERVREEVARSLDRRVGLLTAGDRNQVDAPVVVGTASCITAEKWDVVAVTDLDALLLGSSMGSVERAFRLIYAAAEAARWRLLIQTRSPGHYALQAALRGDYAAFAAAELPRLRAFGYPPYGHLASLTFEGSGDVVRGAVESKLRPAVGPDVAMSDPVPAAGSGGKRSWRILLRSRELEPTSRAGALAVRVARSTYGLKARIEMDPEEV